MRSFRISIARLMGIVLLVALGAAALRSASETTSAIVRLVTQGVLCLAIVGAICRTGAERTWWLGFASFGWMYIGLPFRFLHVSQIGTSQLVLKFLALLFGMPMDDMVSIRHSTETRWFFWIGRWGDGEDTHCVDTARRRYSLPWPREPDIGVMVPARLLANSIGELGRTGQVGSVQSHPEPR